MRLMQRWRIFVAGASGVLGIRLVPLLLAEGHEVAGMTRSPEKAATLRKLGVEPVFCDVYERERLETAVVTFRPEVIVCQLTDLPDDASATADHVAANARIRREGTRNMLAAAKVAQAIRFYAQSVAWSLGGEAGAAAEERERLVLEARGVILRYGRLYGPGTYYQDEAPSPPRIHVDEAARRTVLALQTSSGVLTIVED
jgi:nucleoside-diphosphate-sugar epimerase